MANDNQTYMEQVAAMRQQRRQQELTADYNQAVYGREEALKNRQDIERQSATAFDDEDRNGLADQWHYFDAEVQRCEADMQRLNPPRQQLSPAAQQWIREHKAFFDRHGQRADEAVQGAHRWLTRPGAAGVRVDSPAYYQSIETLLEMHGPHYYGVRFDPTEKELNANEVAKFSKLSGDEYNRASQAVGNAGGFSRQRK